MSILEANNIHVLYGDRIAVAGVSLRVLPHEITAIVGANGAGKSSLLRTLNGAIKPSSGEVLLDNQPLPSFSRGAIARRIAVVSQESLLAFPVSVIEFVLGGRYASAMSTGWGWESERDLQIATEVLKQTELDEYASRLMNELSGGERQRVVLARALATEANVLLLDEPTANLDLAHQASMLRLVRSQCDDHETSAVIVTHEINLAAEFADRVLLLQDGHMIAAGSPHETLTEDLLNQILGIRVLVDAHPLSGAPRITPAHDVRR